MTSEIDLCNGVACPLKRNCKRYLDTEFIDFSNPTYWVEPSYLNGSCKYQIKITRR